MTTSITDEQFEQKLRENQILKWRDLEKGKIYEVKKFFEIETVYGEAWIIELIDDRKIFAPSSLGNLFEKKKDVITTPFYIRPTGMKRSCKNENNQYYSFDVVF